MESVEDSEQIMVSAVKCFVASL